ncbi:MAG: hypothetical protein ACLPX8_02770 [Bryobacteraceae bacterium]|jgi:hypothetical protein
MTELRMHEHAATGAAIVEVWEDGQLIACIYPKDRGIKIVSKYLDGRRRHLVSVDPSPPPALHVNVWDGQVIGDEP